jgi:WhiB family redox-sensing transcriptional regulator
MTAIPTSVRSTAFRPRLAEWEWQESAACAGQDLDLFFGGANESQQARRQRERRAQTLCVSCSVQQRCLQFALTHRIRDGVWGGVGEDDRAAALRVSTVRGKSTARSERTNGDTGLVRADPMDQLAAVGNAQGAGSGWEASDELSRSMSA